MKALRPLPRPVVVALPPNATVNADNTALLPPSPLKIRYLKGFARIVPTSVVSCLRSYVGAYRLLKIAEKLTNDKINLRSKHKRQFRMAHKLLHL